MLFPTNVLTLNNFNDQSKLTSTLASSFSRDPMFRFVFSSEKVDHERKLKYFFSACLKFALSKDTTIHYSPDEQCVALWFHDHSWDDKSSLIWIWYYLVKCFGMRRAWTFLEISGRLSKSHLNEPHMYLWILGTHGDSQGRGLGGSVISKMLEECDQKQIPAYLESSNKANIPFYNRHGFRVLQEVPDLPDGCPPLTAMYRSPKLLQ